MQSLKSCAIVALTIAVLVFQSTTSSQTQEYPAEISPLKTSRPQQRQGSLTPPTKFFRAKRRLPNRYIVVLNDDIVSSDAPLAVRRARITAIADSHAQTYRGRVFFIYETALKGYSIELPDEAAAIAISDLPQVKRVEEVALGEIDSGVIIRKTPQSVCGGTPVTISQLGPKLYGRRTSFLNGGISQRTRLVIRDRDEFNELWKQLFRSRSDKLPLPEVDFSREMIVVAAMGQQPSPGYEIIIDGACEVDNQLEVSVRSTNSLKCDVQSGMVTEPVDIVRLPKTDLRVAFREVEVTSDCKELLRP